MTDITTTTITERLTTATANGYRPLQAELKALKDEKLITLQVKLNSSFEVLREESERLIESHRSIADTQAAIAADIQKVETLLASLPARVITNNSDFHHRILTGSDAEKIWLIKKDGNGEGVTLYKPEGSGIYVSYAGDALKIIALFNTPTIIGNGGVLTTEIKESDLEGVLKQAKKIGLKVHTSTQSASDTDAQKIQKVRASLPSDIITNNFDFGDHIFNGTINEKEWYSKKNKDGAGLTLYKPAGSGIYVSYAGDALRMVALFDTAAIFCNGVLTTEIGDLDLTRIMQKATEIGVKIHSSTVTVLETDAQKMQKTLTGLPSGTIINNCEFKDHVLTRNFDFVDTVLNGSANEKKWLSKKEGNGAGLTLYKPEGGVYYLSYAGDALRIIALLGTVTIIRHGVLMTEIGELDLYGFLRQARKIGLTLTLYRD